MNTIVRNTHGWVEIFPTVVKTIKHLVDTKPGTYRIEDIRIAVNEQLEPREWLTRKMVVQALVKIAEMKRKSHA